MNDRQQLQKAIEYAVETGSFDKRNVIDNAKHVCVYGLGKFFEEAFLPWGIPEKFKIDYFCDKNKDKLEMYKDNKWAKCITVDELKTVEELVVIVMAGNSIPIQKELNSYGIQTVDCAELLFAIIADLPRDKEYFKKNSEKILQVYDILSDEMSKKIFVNILCNRFAPHLSQYSYDTLYSQGEYFSTDLFQVNDNEVFVDCGAYNGDSIQMFLNKVNGNFNKIYAFEMDKENFTKLTYMVHQLPESASRKIKCVNAGVWNEDTTVKYGKEDHGSKGSFSVMKHDNIMEAQAVRLDGVLSNEKITFIKMDIEGAEQAALAGAKKIIEKQKPKMAICVYHRLDAFWDIPLYLKSLVPTYQIGIRHHSRGAVTETVCYAYNNQ